MTDKRKRGTCRRCGGAVERPDHTYAWSHVVAGLDMQHQAAPFPPRERIAVNAEPPVKRKRGRVKQSRSE
jgi:hypothetical protein